MVGIVRGLAALQLCWGVLVANCLVACRPASAPEPAAAQTTLARVQAWAGPTRTVTVVDIAGVRGVELFAAQNAIEYIGIAVVPGIAEPLTGKPAFRTIVARGPLAPLTLATLAMHLLEYGRLPVQNSAVDAPNVLPRHLMLATPPTLTQEGLQYWRRDQRAKGLVRVRLDLSTLHRVMETADELAPVP